MTQVKIDPDKCIGCNTCCLIDPATFELDTSDYKAKVKRQPPEINALVKSSIDSCPTGAISLVDEA